MYVFAVLFRQTCWIFSPPFWRLPSLNLGGQTFRPVSFQNFELFRKKTAHKWPIQCYVILVSIKGRVNLIQKELRVEYVKSRCVRGLIIEHILEIFHGLTLKICTFWSLAFTCTQCIETNTWGYNAWNNNFPKKHHDSWCHSKIPVPL